MNEIDVDVIIDAILEKQDTCTYRDIYDACLVYEEKHPGTYIDKCGDTLDYYLYTYTYRYYVDKNHVIYKQVEYTCPFCNAKHMKFPDVETYNKFLEWSKQVTN